MLRYQLTPGNIRIGPPVWPVESRLVRATDRPTLLMFLHPGCPCSRASLAELETLVRTFAPPPALRLVFFSPAGADPAWVRTDLWSRAAAIPGAECVIDLDGGESRRFGASTSGEALLFGRRGDLQFQGGLTAGRGEIGDNSARRMLAAILTNETRPGRRAPVFGCSLDSSISSCPRCGLSAAAPAAAHVASPSQSQE